MTATLDERELNQLRSDLQLDREDVAATLANLDASADAPLVEMLRASLTNLDDALARLTNGTYGLCEQCGEKMGELRLRALPAARLCLRCEGVPTDDLPPPDWADGHRE